MPVILGGPTARKVIRRGDMACSFQYINDEEAACFYPLQRTQDKARDDRPGAYVVLLHAAWQYADDRYLVQAAAKAAAMMGFDANSKNDVHRIASFIQDMLIELLNMPPKPAELMRNEQPAEVNIASGNRIEVVLH